MLREWRVCFYLNGDWIKGELSSQGYLPQIGETVVIGSHSRKKPRQPDFVEACRVVSREFDYSCSEINIHMERLDEYGERNAQG